MNEQGEAATAADSGAAGTAFVALHAQVLERIGTAICAGELPPGTVVTTEFLESKYGVSRSVVRETLRALEALGMIASRRRVGSTVQPIAGWNVFDPQVIRWRVATSGRISQLRSLTELRTAIEPEAARLAATRGALPQASELMGIAGRLWAAGRGGDAEAFLALDLEYHRLVLRMSGNEMFERLHYLVSEVLVARTNYGLTPQYPETAALQLHVDVANAIQAGNAETAGAAMVQIMHRSLEEMSRVWERG